MDEAIRAMERCVIHAKRTIEILRYTDEPISAEQWRRIWHASMCPAEMLVLEILRGQGFSIVSDYD